MASSSTAAKQDSVRPRVQSVARAAEVLIAVAQSHRGLTTKEISDHLGLSRPGTYHLVHTLSSSGFLTRAADGRYVMGVRIGTLAAAFNRQLAPAEHLAPRVRELARTTGETAYAAGWQNGEIVVLTVARGDNPVQAAEVRPGTAEDGHARASGKLLLAYATDSERADYISRHRLRKRTPHTITERKQFERELERIRETGYAIDYEEFAEGLCCIAVPLDGGASPFVIGLSVPADRFRSEAERYLELALHDDAEAHTASSRV